MASALSRLGNLWEGVSTHELLERTGGCEAGSALVMGLGYDRGWNTNLLLADFLEECEVAAGIELIEKGPPRGFGKPVGIACAVTRGPEEDRGIGVAGPCPKTVAEYG